VAKIDSIKKGVLPIKIIIEKTSTVTCENIIGARKVLSANKIKSVLIVSDPLHMRRAMTMAYDLDTVANAAPTPTSMYKSWNSKIEFLAREIIFYSVYLLKKS